MLDADVLIERLRGNPGSIEYFDHLKTLPSPPVISAITVAEIWGGARKGEESEIENLLSSLEVKDIDREMAIKGGKYRRDLGNTAGTDLPDGIVGATAEFYGLELRTWNVKHFPMLDHVSIPYVRAHKPGSAGPGR